jgi:RNA polymerase sigma-70 factor (ECF subfamily)
MEGAMEPDGFHDLVRRAQAGDRQAMNRVLELLRPHLEAQARRYADPARASASVSDLVQEVRLRAWQKIDQFRGGTTDEQTLALFRAWLGQIVQRLGLNAQRRRKAQRRQPPQPLVPLSPSAGEGAPSRAGGIDPVADGPTPSVNVRADEEARLVQAALEKIPDETDRAILRLRFFDGLSLRQTALQLGLGYDKVRDRYQLLLQRLERELGRFL